MSALSGTRRFGLVVLGALIVLSGLTAAVRAASAKPDYSVSISPASQSVVQGNTAAYTVTVQSSNGFAGAVALSVSALPKNGIGSFSSASVTVATNGSATSTLSVATNASTSTGSKSFTVNANSGSTSHSVSATMTVTTAPAGATFTLAAAPSAVTVAAGGSAAYTITATSKGYAGSVSLTAATSPVGPVLSLSPTSVSSSGGSSTLTASTSSSLAPGNYTLTVTGAASGQTTQTTAVTLTVVTGGKPFTMTGGTSTSVAPGSPSAPVDVTFTNPNSSALSITNLSVSVSSVTPAGTGTCGPSDYSVAQYTGPYPISIAAKGQTSLSTLLPTTTSSWPQLLMVDKPRTNQDGCKGATVTLAFTGSGTGG